MKRHPLLIELSQEHHHTLALCVRILRAPETDHRHDITEHFIDLEKHFAKEETMFAPLWDKLDRADLRSRYLLSIHSKSFGVAAFLFAFAAAFGQITSLAFYIRQVARDKMLPPTNPSP